MANITVTNSLFTTCSGHTISIFAGGVGTKLKCIGNTFEDNEKHPAVEEVHNGTRPTYRPIINDSDEYILRDNVIKGNDMYEEQVFDANTVYRTHDT